MRLPTPATVTAHGNVPWQKAVDPTVSSSSPNSSVPHRRQQQINTIAEGRHFVHGSTTRRYNQRQENAESQYNSNNAYKSRKDFWLNMVADQHFDAGDSFVQVEEKQQQQQPGNRGTGEKRQSHQIYSTRTKKTSWIGQEIVEQKQAWSSSGSPLSSRMSASTVTPSPPKGSSVDDDNTGIKINSSSTSASTSAEKSAVNIVQHWERRIQAMGSGVKHTDNRKDSSPKQHQSAVKTAGNSSSNRFISDAMTNPHTGNLNTNTQSLAPLSANNPTSFFDNIRTVNLKSSQQIKPPATTSQQSLNKPYGNEKLPATLQETDDESTLSETTSSIQAVARKLSSNENGNRSFTMETKNLNDIHCSHSSRVEESVPKKNLDLKHFANIISMDNEAEPESNSLIVQSSTAGTSFARNEVSDFSEPNSHAQSSFQHMMGRSQEQHKDERVSPEINNEKEEALMIKIGPDVVCDGDEDDSDGFCKYTSERSPFKMAKIHEVSAISAASSDIGLVSHANPDDQMTNPSDRFVDSDTSDGDKSQEIINFRPSTPTTALVILQKGDTYQIVVGERGMTLSDELVIKNTEIVAGDRNTTNEHQKCQCIGSIFGGDNELMSFFLPQMGMACTCGRQIQMEGLTKPGDPTAIDNVLRPWQVQFLKSFGIHHGDQLVKTWNRSGDILARALRQWRKKEEMATFKTSSCAMAIQLWAKCCKIYVRSVRQQLRTGTTHLERPPGALISELSEFLVGLPAAPAKRKDDSVPPLPYKATHQAQHDISRASLPNIEPESQVEV